MIKEIDDAEHAIVSEWGKKNHEFTILPKEFLPRGLILYKDDKPVMAGFMYISDDLTMALIAYVIANPESDTNERSEAFPQLIDAFHDIAKAKNVKFLFTTTNNASLTNRFRQVGFIEADTDVVHLLKPVQ